MKNVAKSTFWRCYYSRYRTLLFTISYVEYSETTSVIKLRVPIQIRSNLISIIHMQILGRFAEWYPMAGILRRESDHSSEQVFTFRMGTRNPHKPSRLP